jgi:hypothetical protein
MRLVTQRFPWSRRMCIFSGPISAVSETRIFAAMAGNNQSLVYDMHLASPSDVAMILPIPVSRATDDPIQFIDLSKYPRFFDDMDDMFYRWKPRSGDDPACASASLALLPVHRVGGFDASFVPSLSDFARLAPSFRLPDEVWNQFPAYAAYAFAVFQLRAGNTQIHPMAFTFHAKDPKSLYFPTTHVHDGTVPDLAEFDHTLYTQASTDSPHWIQSPESPASFMMLNHPLFGDRTKGLVSPQLPVSRRKLNGHLKNQDLRLAVP